MIFAFGEYALDLARRELRCGDDAVALQPQAFDLLVYLIHQRHRVVSKSDLVQAVWGGRAVSDSALATRINAVRRALGDDGTRQKMIRTHTGNGFRFLGDVTEMSDAGRPVMAPAPPDALAHSRSPAISDRISVAALPLTNLTADDALNYFADGTVEEIATGLSRIRWLSVIPRMMIMAGPIRVPGAMPGNCESEARYLVTGSVRANGRRLRVTARLVEAQTGVQLWAEHFDGVRADAFGLQERVASGVAGAIEPILLALESANAARWPATDPSGYEAYLRAFAMASSARQIPQALALLETAIARDSHYAPALGLAANCCMRLAMDGVSRNPAADVGRGADYARRALQAAPDDPGALANAARPLAYAGETIDMPIALMDRALALNPNFARGWYIRGFLKYWAGDLDDGINDVETALRLSPRCRFGTPFLAIANALVFAERFEEAIRTVHRAILQDPSFPPNYRLLAICHAHLGRFDQARAALNRLPDTAPLVVPNVIRSYHAMVRHPDHRKLVISGIRLAAGEMRRPVARRR